MLENRVFGQAGGGGRLEAAPVMGWVRVNGIVDSRNKVLV